MDVIFCRKKQFSENMIQCHISFDLSKAFDRVKRNKLRSILYGKGIPTTLIRNIIEGRQKTYYMGQHNGATWRKILNNKGAFRGGPVSALLYITFDDGITNGYNEELKNHRHKENPRDCEKSPTEFQ